MGDGTTLELFPLPEGEPLRFQEIYQANLSCIVSVRGTKGSSMSLGTGVIMSENGYIITNSHVIEGCSAVDVVLWDERVYPALLVGRDEQTDLAVLKVECTGSPPPTLEIPACSGWGMWRWPSAIRWARTCGAP